MIQNDDLFSYVFSIFGLQNCPDDIKHNIRNEVKLFHPKINDHQAQSCRHLDKFLWNYSHWLEEEIKFSEEVHGTIVATQSQEISMPEPSKGHHVKLFTECSSKCEKRRV